MRVSERITEITSLLRAKTRLLLSELLENEPSRLVIIVTFLAVLELWKRSHITVAQSDLFGPIALERGEKWSEDIHPDPQRATVPG